MEVTKKQLAKAKQTVKKSGSQDESNVSRVVNGGWKFGAAHYIQCHLTQATLPLAKAVRKNKKWAALGCFSTLDKAIARVDTLKGIAKQLGFKKATM